MQKKTEGLPFSCTELGVICAACAKNNNVFLRAQEALAAHPIVRPVKDEPKPAEIQNLKKPVPATNRGVLMKAKYRRNDKLVKAATIIKPKKPQDGSVKVRGAIRKNILALARQAIIDRQAGEKKIEDEHKANREKAQLKKEIERERKAIMKKKIEMKNLAVMKKRAEIKMKLMVENAKGKQKQLKLMELATVMKKSKPAK